MAEDCIHGFKFRDTEQTRSDDLVAIKESSGLFDELTFDMAETAMRGGGDAMAAAPEPVAHFESFDFVDSFDFGL